MAELVQSNVALLVVALVLAAIVALWLVMANRRTRIELAPREDEGPAKRNQALIDAAPAVATIPPEPVTIPVAEMLATPEPAPAPEPAPTPAPAPAAGGDDLTLIKGLGPKLKTELAALGVISFAQIAQWSEADIDRVDAQLGRFQGRIRRDAWVEQARLLAAGDMAGFAGKFGNN